MNLVQLSCHELTLLVTPRNLWASRVMILSDEMIKQRDWGWVWYLQQLQWLEAEERQVEVQIYGRVVFVFLGWQDDAERAQVERLQDTRVFSKKWHMDKKQKTTHYWNERAKDLTATHTRWSRPGGGMGTSASLAANSFTLSSTSAKRHIFSWIRRLPRQKNKRDGYSSRHFIRTSISSTLFF